MSIILGFLAPLAFCLLIIYLLGLYAKRQFLLSKLSWIPGPSALPIIGNYYDLIAPPPEVAFKHLKDYDKKYDKLYKIWIGATPTIHCQDSDIVKEAFKNEDSVSRPAMYLGVRGFLGPGLLFGESGDKWRMTRKHLSGSFHTVILDEQVKLIAKKIKPLIDILEKKSQDNKHVDLIEHLKPYFLDISLVTMVGVETESMSTPESIRYLDAVERMSDIVMTRLFSPILKFNCLFNLSSLKKSEVIAKDGIKNYINKYVAERTIKTVNVEYDDKPKILTDAMVDLEKQNSSVTDEDVFNQVSNHIFASYDTLSTAVSYLLFLLGIHMDIQEEVVKEIDSIAPKLLTEGISLKESNKLNLLDRCLKESLRMFPPAAMIGRRINKPLTTKRGTIPAGVDLYVEMQSYHRNEDIYPDPDKFDPDRFLPENVTKRSTLSWIPFGIGARTCIGQKQAMIQARIASAFIIKKFIVKSYEEPKDLLLSANLMIKSKNGIRVYLTPRESS